MTVRYKRLGQKVLTTGNRLSVPREAMEFLGAKKDDPILFLVDKQTNNLVLKKGKAVPTDIDSDEIESDPPKPT